jgi:hypothetical protein
MFAADFWGHRHISYSTSTLLIPLEIFAADFSFFATMPVIFVADFWLNLSWQPNSNLCG